MTLKEVWANLWISIVSAPVVWVVTVVFSDSISGAISVFGPDWYAQYWYITIPALVIAAGLQIVALSYYETRTVILSSLFVFFILSMLFVTKQILGSEFPVSLRLTFAVFCLCSAQLAVLCAYACIVAIRKSLSLK